jgi:hypothetical protein
VPRGALICKAEAQNARFMPIWRMRLLHPAVRRTVHELFDRCDLDGSLDALSVCPFARGPFAVVVVCALRRVGRAWQS